MASILNADNLSNKIIEFHECDNLRKLWNRFLNRPFDKIDTNPYYTIFKAFKELFANGSDAWIFEYQVRDECIKIGWSVPTPSTIQEITKRSNKIVTISSGRGYWSKVLSLFGCDVIATDSFNEIGNADNIYFPIDKKTNLETIESLDDSQRDIFIAWGRSSYDLKNILLSSCWKGKYLFVIGEGEMGCTASPDDFINNTDDWYGWKLTHHEIPKEDKFSGIHDNLYICERIKSATAIMHPLGFGTYQLRDQTAKNSILHALKVGYRHIDTASLYKNEAYVGEAIKESGIPRSEIFITTKVNIVELIKGREAIIKSVNKSLQRLQTDYVDLLLIHKPIFEEEKLKQAWETFEFLQQSGKVLRIGVSNFEIPMLNTLLQNATIKPYVNQIEIHPLLPRPLLVGWCKENGILPVAYAILNGKLDKYKPKDLIQWAYINNLTILLRSSNPIHIEENFINFHNQIDNYESYHDLQNIKNEDYIPVYKQYANEHM
jgi:diketogulonate reductase-like aldo/keto reductase